MSEETERRDAAEDLKALEAALDKLIEQFDTVQIFATRHEAGEHDGTVNIKLGRGNWFARYGQVRNWVIQEEEATRLKLPRSGEQQ